MFSTPEVHNKKVVYENKSTKQLSVVDEPIKLTKAGEEYTVGSNEVLVKVHTAGFNPIDILVKNVVPSFLNYYYPHFGLCNDYSGTVEAIGDAAKTEYGLKVGDKVCGQTKVLEGMKTLAEYIVVTKVDAIVKAPSNLTMNEAGSFSLVYSTGAQMIDLAKIQPNSKVLVNGASTSVGKYVVQMLKLNPNVDEIIAICSGKSEPIVKLLGADKVVDYTKTNSIINSVLEETKDKKFDTFLDCCGSEKLMANLGQFIVKNGVYVNIAGGKKNNLSADSMLNLVTFGSIKNSIKSMLGLSPVKIISMLVTPGFQLKEGVELMEAGKIKPFIHQVFPFEEYQEAYELVRSGKNNGKVVVQVSD